MVPLVVEVERQISLTIFVVVANISINLNELYLGQYLYYAADRWFNRLDPVSRRPPT